MKIAVIGASGKAGSKIMAEALSRGHDVTAIVRDGSKVAKPKAKVLEKDIFELDSADLAAFDVVVNAFGAPLGEENPHVEAGKKLIEAMKGAPDTRLIVVGGAGSLYVDEAETVRLIDTPEFPDIFKPTASGQGRNLADLEQSEGIKWTFVSPAAIFDPEGKRTGAYKAGKDKLIVNSKGESYISYADYAIAIVDEIENPKHPNTRFTVVSESE
ncbi:NAD(P)-dependent oxidoreductase [Cohnella pontilimi]|uniref:NAD(P)-dependent oxidoreductase n=1 Tax=Cohnella pontilimi TaxID=2564100 RepID=A0A4U0FAJ8_9BACL|nr:NAD(P)-dependent oxidoreductase [Cohnella pontilimi]TJY41174.1 NAD(P)-dependent oxidoreductase [Cohnella pontilimi]